MKDELIKELTERLKETTFVLENTIESIQEQDPDFKSTKTYLECISMLAPNEIALIRVDKLKFKVVDIGDGGNENILSTVMTQEDAETDKAFFDARYNIECEIKEIKG